MKKTRLFLGGLPWAMENDSLTTLIEEGDESSGTEGCGSGTVKEVTVVRERETGRSRGFAFITMISVEKATEAIQKFNKLKYAGRELKVDEASDQSNRRDEERSPRRNSGNHSRGYSRDRREYYSDN